MNLREVRSFLAIYDWGTVRAASEYLNVTQPALSQTLRKLETKLQVELFRRTGTGMEPTAAARALLEPARRIIDAENTAWSAVRDVTGLVTGHITVGVMPGLAAAPVAAWVARFRNLYPQITIALHRYEPRQSINEFLTKGPSEIVISHYYYDCDHSVVTHHLGHEQLIPIFPFTQLLPKRGVIEIADMKNIPIIISPPGSSMYEVVKTAYSDAGVKLAISVETQFMDSFIDLVIDGAGAAFIPRATAQRARERGITIKDITPHISRNIYAFHHKNKLTAEARRFLSLITDDSHTITRRRTQVFHKPPHSSHRLD